MSSRKKQKQTRHGIVMIESLFSTDDNRTSWLFKFLRVDLGRASAGELIGLLKDAIGFPNGLPDDFDEIPRLEALPEEQRVFLSRLQTSLRDGLKRLYEGEHWKLEGRIGYAIVAFGMHSRRIFGFERQGTFSDIFTASAFEVVQENWDRMRQCQRCGDPFLRTGKQIFCSGQCSQKTQWDRFKASRGARNYRAEREQAVRKRYGANVKPGRRRQRTS
jgi:hypothetical protein